MTKLALSLLPFLIWFSPLLGQPKDLVYDNKSFKHFVKTVRLYPISTNPYQSMDAPIVPTPMVSTLLLQFDMLMEEYEIKLKVIKKNQNLLLNTGLCSQNLFLTV